MSRPRILMCPADYYGIEYEINAWMNRERNSDRELALRQWHDLHSLFVRLGADVVCMSPVPGLPDLVFTANAALIYRDRAVISRFRHEVRQREVPHNRKWFFENGFAPEETPEGTYFEGAGDALFCGETLFAGYRLRSDVQGIQQIAKRLGVRVIPLELIDPFFYHVDTCFCPLDYQTAIYYPAAFDEYGQRVLREHVPRLIPVNDAEARRFACNAVVLGRNVVTNTGCEELHAQLRPKGYTPFETALDEFVKAGGSAKCLTLRLDGEEAAAWRTGATDLSEKTGRPAV